MRYASWRSIFGRRNRPAERARFQPGIESLERRDVPTVTYHGGAVIPHVQTQNLYLGSGWETNTTARSQVKDFEKYNHFLVTSSYITMLTTAGYGVGRGSFLSGRIDPLALSTKVELSDDAIRHEIQREFTRGILAAPNSNRLTVVYVQPGTVVQFEGETSKEDFDGYHDAFLATNRLGQKVWVPYAVVPYLAGANATGSPLSVFQDMTATASHEVVESITDPGTRGLGWYDANLNAEIADTTSLTIRLDGWVLQKYVSKADNPLTPPGAVNLFVSR